MKRIVFLMLLVGFGSFVFGQQTTNTTDRALRSSGRVNPSTLAMEFDLPLGSYPGRGINVPITLSYSSKLWRMKPYGLVESGLYQCSSLSKAHYSETSASGWKSSLSTPYIEYVGIDNLYESSGFPLDGAEGCVYGPSSSSNLAAFVRRIMVHLPNGESHELRADDQIDYSYRSNPTWGLQEHWNRTYYAVDGSNIKYVENSDSSLYRLLMPDGSYYDFETSRSNVYGSTARKATRFVDRNGNFTTYNPQTGVWTDTLGRTLTAPIAPTAPSQPTPTGSPMVYSMPGMTGTYKFHWKKLKGDSASESGLTDFNQNLKYTGDKIAMGNNSHWSSHPAGTYLFSSGSFGSESIVQADFYVFNPIVLTEIELPTGQKYKFSYNIYGLIERITYPTGGEEKFVYQAVPSLSQSEPGNVYDQVNLGVVNRKVYETAGQGTPYEWTYSATHVDPSGYKISITAPDDTVGERFLHQGNPSCSGCTQGQFGYDNGLAGMPYEERSFSNTGDIVSRKLISWAKTSMQVWSYPFNGNGNNIVYGHYADVHPRIAQEESIIYDADGNGVSATVKYEYEGDLTQRESPVLVNKTTQYAYVPLPATQGRPEPDEDPDPNPTPIPTPTPSSLTPVRIVETNYLISDPAYIGVKSYYTTQNMIGLVTATQVKNGPGTVVSRAETVYDEAGHSPGYRGNPTSSRAWDSTKGPVTSSSAYISTSAKFDSYGNQYEATDAKGNTTTTAFDPSYHTFPIQVTSPIPSDGTHGSISAFVTTVTFDPVTGLPLTTIDANGQETRIEYDPITLRPKNTKTYFNSVQVGSVTETVYHDQPNNYWVKNRAQIDENKWAESITYFDGLGRAYKTEEVNAEGNIFVEKEFDAEGRVKRVSNPFRAGETKYWTNNVYDEASRVKEVILQDGSTIKTDYGVSVTTPIGVTKQITDQAGKKRKGISDALGRMIRVIEDPSGQSLNTDYVFDALGNLRQTIQGTQNRFFMHDSLGRLLYAKQPEQDTRVAFVATDLVTGNTAWSVKYEYDDNSNLIKTTDARGTSIEATYDNVNRIKLRNYSDATPDVSFYYDGKYLDVNDTPQTATGSVKGKTTGVKSSVSRTNYTSFDNLGRLLTHQQITDGQVYNTAYTYNLSGALIEETYPSTRVVKYTLDENGDLTQVRSKKTASHGYWTYAGAFSYDSSGNTKKMQLGNGLWETSVYNERQQIKQIGLGITDADQNFLRLEYKYDTNTSSHDNNGNLREQKITVPGIANPFIQTYIYDDLNRLKSATETNGGTETWKQTFEIDRYGNREFDAANTTTLGTCATAVCNPAINASDNRFSSGQGYSYDLNGNITQDAQSQRFGYDAENRQNEFFATGNGTSTPDATYLYDGDGRRVKKITSTEVTVFVYNASGNLVAEYSTALATTPQVSYLTTDHLGSPRVVANENGIVKDRKDYSAFGEESTSVQRSSNAEYSAADQLRKSYTGYEKDGESGLEFAQARYYNPTHGRFTSVDPLAASASIRNPQTFNRYSYVLNSPYKYTDPLGLIPWIGRSWGGAASWGGSQTGAPAAFGCSAEYASCSGSGWDESASPLLPENDPVVVNLNIVYDSKQMSEAGARESMKDAIADLQNAYGAINVQFNITFTAGTADMTSNDVTECPNCAYNITSGAVDGAVNVFLHDNTKNLKGGLISRFNPANRQIFLEKSGGVSLKQKLTHEIGHLFRYFVNGDPRGGIPLPAHTGAGWTLVGSNLHSEDSIIDSANDQMRKGGLKYGVDYVDDYRSITTTMVTPGFTAKHLGEMAPRHTVTRNPTPFDVYRLGARLVAAQGR